MHMLCPDTVALDTCNPWGFCSASRSRAAPFAPWDTSESDAVPAKPDTTADNTNTSPGVRFMVPLSVINRRTPAELPKLGVFHGLEGLATARAPLGPPGSR